MATYKPIDRQLGGAESTEEIERVSVVICTFTTQRYDNVMDCVSSLKAQTFAPIEIILVLDPIESLVSFFKSRMPSDIKIVSSEDIGLSNARNAGVRNAAGNIIAFVDDDAVPERTWLEKMVRNYKDADVIGVGGLIKAEWEEKRPTWFPEELDWIVGCTYKGFPKVRSIIRNPIGCNMSFRSWVFHEAGYFRTDFGRLGQKLTANEETEFSIRACSKIPQSKIIYDPSAVVHHKVSAKRESLNYVWTRSFNEGVSKAMIAEKERLSKLSTEDVYLKYLLGVAIPSRVRQVYRYENISQLLVLIYSTAAVLTGFASYKLRR